MNAQPLNIFVAEDDEDDRFILELAFKDTAIPVKITMVSNGDELLNLLEAVDFVPYMILLDIIMPKMDGLTALRKIRDNPTYNALPIIVFSRFEDPASILKAYEYGATMFIKKPMTYNNYLLILNNLFSEPLQLEPSVESFVRRW